MTESPCRICGVVDCAPMCEFFGTYGSGTVADLLARLRTAEARIKGLEAALLTFVKDDEAVYGVGHTERSRAGREALGC